MKKGEVLISNQWYQKIADCGNFELDKSIKNGSFFKNRILSSPVKIKRSNSIRPVKLTELCTTDIEINLGE